MELFEFGNEIFDIVDIKKLSGDIFDIRLKKTTATESEYWQSSGHSLHRSNPEVFFSGKNKSTSRFIVFDFLAIWTTSENLDV
jgi:hypothetical protein